jgi:hypothetical protein
VLIQVQDEALSSFQRVASSTSPAPTKDVEKYRKWMAENKPIVEAEARYLDVETDLLSLTQQKPDPPPKSPSSSQLTALMMAITSATALPILLFRIRPGFASRLTVILLLVPSVVFMPKAHAPGSLLSPRESRQFLFVYFGVLVFAALVI